MSRRSLWTLFGVALLPAALATLPLQVALPLLGVSPPLSAHHASGTIWHGQLQQARWNRAPLGTVTLRLSPWSLALGELDLQARSPRLAGILVHGRRTGVRDLHGELDLALPGLPLHLRFEHASAVFGGDACRSATGTVTIRTGRLQPAGADLPSLQAAPRCDGGQWLAEFTDGSGLPAAELRLDAGGRYRLLLQEASALALAGADAPAAGFAPTADRAPVNIAEGSVWQSP